MYLESPYACQLLMVNYECKTSISTPVLSKPRALKVYEDYDKGWRMGKRSETPLVLVKTEMC